MDFKGGIINYTVSIGFNVLWCELPVGDLGERLQLSIMTHLCKRNTWLHDGCAIFFGYLHSLLIKPLHNSSRRSVATSYWRCLSYDGRCLDSDA